VEGARRLEEWNRLTAQLPSLDARVEVDAGVLTERLTSLPDEGNGLLRLADGTRTLRDVIDESGRDEIEAAALLVRLHAEGVLRVAPALTPQPTEGTPAPEGVEWFADPAEARRAAQAAETGLPLPDRSRRPASVRHSQAPRWVVGAVLVLAAAILLGPEWARRRRELPPPDATPAAEPAVPSPAAAPAPPALAVTEPASAGIRLPPAEPGPSTEGAPERPAPRPERAAPPPERAAPRQATAAQPLPPAHAAAMAEGEASYRSGDFPAAATAFRRALAIRETSEAQASLGRALSDAGQTDLALAAFRRAAALDASNGAAWLGLGEVLMTLGDPARARVAYERYLAVDPAGRHAGEVRSVLARLRP
jgi:hypothetical protein